MNEQEISKAVEAVLESWSRSGRDKHKECKLTLDIANALIERVKAFAHKMGVRVVIAVSDQAGRPVAVQCMDDAYIASFDIAVNKSFTSASLKMSTETLSHLSQPGQSLYGIQHTNQGRIVIFGGGEPLEVDGKILGALGVSGGSAKQDTEIAAYGRKIFKEVLSCH